MKEYTYKKEKKNYEYSYIKLYQLQQGGGV